LPIGTNTLSEVVTLGGISDISVAKEKWGQFMIVSFYGR
jgi:hypothetical protein